MVDFTVLPKKHLKYLTLLGLWPETRKERIRQYIVLMIVGFYFAVQVNYIISIATDFKKLLNSLTTILNQMYILVKFLYVDEVKSVMISLTNRLQNDVIFQPKNRRQEKIIKREFKEYRKLYVACIIVYSLTWFLGLPCIFIKKFRIFPSKIPFLEDLMEESPYWQIFSCFQMLCLLWVLVVYVVGDFLSFYYFNMIRIQIFLLADNVEHVVEDSLVDGKLIEKRLEQKFLGCIEHHKEILEVFTKVSSACAALSFNQLWLSSLSLCLSLFNLTAGYSKDVAPFHMTLVTMMIWALYLFSVWADKVTQASMQLPNAAFNCNWVEAPIGFRKRLLFFMHRTQTPLVFTVANLFDVNLDVFKKMVRITYSAYNVLFKTNSRN